MSRYIDADAIKIPSTSVDMFENCRNCNLLDEFQVREIIDSAPSIDIVRCKECASYCGDGNKCLWGLLTVDMGYCHHGYRSGDCIAKPQTERERE